MARDALVAPAVRRGGRTIGELFDDDDAYVAAVQDAVDEAIERHRLLGESIVSWEHGRVVEIPADQIEPLVSVRARRKIEREARAAESRSAQG